MVKRIPFLSVGEVNSEPLVREEGVELFESEVLFLMDEFDKRDLVERVNVIDGAAKVSKEADKAELLSLGGIEEGS